MTKQVFQWKKTPCNGCREKKRKCSYEQPCSRCARVGINCIYTIMQSPKDLEYMQELEYINQIESIQYQMSCMEKEIAVLKLANQSSSLHDYPSPVSMNTSLSPVQKTVQTTSNTLDPPLFNDFTTKDDRVHFIQHLKDHEKDTTEEPPAWDMVVKNGQLSFNTHITSHAQLLATLSRIANQHPQFKHRNPLPVPLYSMPMAQTNAIGAVMSIMVWRKYTKTRVMSYAHYKPLMLLKDSGKELSRVVPVEGLTTITLRLLAAYFRCGQYNLFTLYVPAFIERYMQGDILKSPVAMALCSMICFNFCKHLLEILPMDALEEYALYYFEQARILIEEKFDEMDMEAMMTFAFMGYYKLKTRDYQEAQRYVSMAERIYEVLRPMYSKESQEPDDIVFFRCYRAIYNCRCGIDLHMSVEDVSRPHVPPQRLLELLDFATHIPIAEGPLDTEREKQFIVMYQYLIQLRKVITEGGRNAVAPDYPTFVSVFGHHIEMGMRHWYRSALPKQFQLSLPLFDDHIDDLKFFTVLETECGEQPVKLLSLINVYNEYLVMAKSYVPRRPEETQLDTNDLIRRFKELQYTTMHELRQELKKDTDARMYHWLKLVAKMRYFRQYHKERFTDEELEESDEAYFVRFIKAMNPSDITFDMPITHTSIKAALNMVRLSQFLLTRDYACMFDARWILNAWDILLRAARFKYQQPEDPGVTVDRIRANLLVCLDIIKAFLAYSSRNENITLLDELQEEFNQIFLCM